MMSLEFVIEIKSFRSHYGSGVDSASKRNEYQECFLGGKCGRCVRLTIHHPVPLSWDLATLTSWNPLDHSRPVMGLLYLYVTVYNQLSCVPNRPCCFRYFGIQRRFLWRIEHGLSSSIGVPRNFVREGFNKFIRGKRTDLYLYLYTLHFTREDAFPVLYLFHLDVSCGEMLSLIQSQVFHSLGWLLTR